MTEEGRLSVSSANCDTAHIPGQTTIMWQCHTLPHCYSDTAHIPGHAVYHATHYHTVHIAGWPRYTRLHAGYTKLNTATVTLPTSWATLHRNTTLHYLHDTVPSYHTVHTYMPSLNHSSATKLLINKTNLRHWTECNSTMHT